MGVYRYKDAALGGVYSGEYYAAVIISSDFTYSMYNVFREDFKGTDHLLL